MWIRTRQRHATSLLQRFSLLSDAGLPSVSEVLYESLKKWGFKSTVSDDDLFTLHLYIEKRKQEAVSEYKADRDLKDRYK